MIPEAMSHTRPRSTSTRAEDSTNKTCIMYGCLQQGELPLRPHLQRRQHQRLLQQQRLLLHLQQPLHRVVRLQLRRGRRPPRERNPRQGFVLPRRRDRKAGESWSAFAKATADRQLLADSWFGGAHALRVLCSAPSAVRTANARAMADLRDGVPPLAEAAAIAWESGARGRATWHVRHGEIRPVADEGACAPQNSRLRFFAEHPWLRSSLRNRVALL